jgi:hypothetical protein
MIASFFKYLIIGLVALFALKFVLAAIGLAIGLLALAIPAACVAALGYGVYRLIAPKKSKQISDADRRWLES